MSESSSSRNLLELRPEGLYCAAGPFFIDPKRPVTRALITHAHADHARPGAGSYICSRSSAPFVAQRVGKGATVKSLPFGESLRIGDAIVSFHPAGHILGSAQVRVEVRGEVWVVSGDYKTEPCATCESFEAVRCHTFITECTFGLPVYRWPMQREVLGEINSWWQSNRERGKTSVLLAYSLGKAQRLLHYLNADIGPVAVHGAVKPFVNLYRAGGIAMPLLADSTLDAAPEVRARGMVVVPPGVDGSQWLSRFRPYSVGFASGWMQLRGRRRRAGYDRGFVLSDHADWPGLLSAIESTGAERVITMHGNGAALVRFLQERGLDAQELGVERDAQVG